MTVLELSELVKVLEKKFGVSAAAVAVAGPAAAGAGEDAKSTFDLELTDSGANKIAVIKAVKEALALGLKEAKDLVDGVPSMVKQGMKKEDADELKKKLEDAGGKVTLKQNQARSVPLILTGQERACFVCAWERVLSVR